MLLQKSSFYNNDVQGNMTLNIHSSLQNPELQLFNFVILAQIIFPRQAALF